MDEKVVHYVGLVYLKCLVPFALRALHEGVYKRMGIGTDGESTELDDVRRGWHDWLSRTSDAQIEQVTGTQ